MSEGNNNVLIALALLERLEPQLKIDKREQISKSNLDLMQRTITQILTKINGVKLENEAVILGNLISVSELIEDLVNDAEFVQTDTATKEIIAAKCMEALDLLYIATGKYYTVADFEPSMRVEAMIIKVIKYCVQKGYYFGKDV